MTDRPHCLDRGACAAVTPGKHCNRCTSRSPDVRARKSAAAKKAFAENPDMLQRRIDSALRLTRDPAVVAKRNATAKVRWADPELRARHSTICALRVAQKMKDPAFVERLREAGRTLGKLNLERARNPESRRRAGEAIRRKHLAWCPEQYWDLNAKLKASGFLLDERKAIILAQADHDSPEAVAMRQAREEIFRITNDMHAKAEREKEMAY